MTQHKQHRAVDIYTSYFFFSLSSRLPLLSTLTAAVALTTFLVVVAYEAWPVGVLVTFFGWGVMMTLQFLVFGVHWVVRGVGRVGRELGRAVRRVVGWLGGLVRGRRGTGVGGRE
ncbi:hypothetical protein L208DRAFT_61194 [Tricholoma matsutake]|nr:hypothetical protein L208DRAFT_61194 [Tricholoma matsutake 945]